MKWRKLINMKKIKVLHVINGMGSGGAEMVIMNWLRNIDLNKFQFDFLLRSKKNIFDTEIKKAGGNVYYTSSFPNHFIKNHYETKHFFEKNKYDIVHVHGNALIYMTAFIQAKKNNIPVIIAHSHNTKVAKWYYTPLHIFNRMRITKYANVYLACSNDAGKWMFNNNKYKVIDNAVDQKKFSFNLIKRNELRSKYNFNDKIVIGHIGRFLKSKNHSFIIKVFKEIEKHNKNVVLLLIGEGPDKPKIENLVKDEKLDDKVLFLGIRNDIPDLMQCMDLLLFPSLYEGFPVTLVEAQVAKLPCLISDNITKDVQISNELSFLSLNDNIKKWANKSIELANIDRNLIKFNEKKSNYDIKNVTKKLSDIYESKLKEINK